jgi:hypothetical protein
MQVNKQTDRQTDRKKERKKERQAHAHRKRTHMKTCSHTHAREYTHIQGGDRKLHVQCVIQHFFHRLSVSTGYKR